LACAAASAVIATMRAEKLVERTESVGAIWKNQIESLAAKHNKVIKEVRGKGFMIGIEMGEKSKEFQKHAFCSGILVNVAGGKTVRLVPPLIVRLESISKLNLCLGEFLARQ